VFAKENTFTSLLFSEMHPVWKGHLPRFISFFVQSYTQYGKVRVERKWDVTLPPPRELLSRSYKHPYTSYLDRDLTLSTKVIPSEDREEKQKIKRNKINHIALHNFCYSVVAQSMKITFLMASPLHLKCMHACMHACMCVCVCVYVSCMCVCVCVYV